MTESEIRNLASRRYFALGWLSGLSAVAIFGGLAGLATYRQHPILEWESLSTLLGIEGILALVYLKYLDLPVRFTPTREGLRLQYLTSWSIGPRIVPWDSVVSLRPGVAGRTSGLVYRASTASVTGRVRGPFRVLRFSGDGLRLVKAHFPPDLSIPETPQR